MNAPAPKITRMKYAYQLEGQEEQETVIHNRSLIAWDETRGKRKWPSAEDAPFLWQSFILWHHLNRTGVYKAQFPEFQDECVALESIDDEVPVNPTQTAATPDSFSESD